MLPPVPQPTGTPALRRTRIPARIPSTLAAPFFTLFLGGTLRAPTPSTLAARCLPVLGGRADSSTDCHATIFAVGPGKVDLDVIWTGSDDGLVNVTRDGGATWTNVTPPDMPTSGGSA